jgi:CDP-diacylglycerol---serine O-phosphatidyltransferase
MKQIPNIFTLLNLLLGCMALICLLQPGITIQADEYAQNVVILPERMVWASCLIAAAAVVDFLDGMVARWMNATSEIGAQLDSLSDVVSFGVAPGMIAFQFLRYSFAQEPNGLDISEIWLLPAFLIPMAGAYRLARFNVSGGGSKEFTGVPIPAIGLWLASFPMVNKFTSSDWQFNLISNHWFWYGVILVASYLMVSRLPMLAFKFSGNQESRIKIRYLVALVAITAIACWMLGWLGVTVGFIAYLALSLLYKKNTHDLSGSN